MLKIEDVKVGDKVEVLQDFFGALVIGSIHTISYVTETHFKIEGDEDLWDKHYLSELFKKKEKSQQYTFDDLIDVAVQAFRDDVIFAPTFLKQNNKLAIVIKGIEKERGEIFPECSVERCLNHIQSLYKETFVIECEEDICNTKDGATIILANGNIVKFRVLDGMWKITDDDKSFHSCGLLVLKGATVEQSK